MRRLFKTIFIILAIAALAVSLFACEKAVVPDIPDNGDGEQTTGESVKISFFSDGSLYGIAICTEDGTFAMPKDPVKDGYSFIGWFYDEQFNTPFIYEEFILNQNKTDTSLYAAWDKIDIPEPPDGGDSGDGGEGGEEGGDGGETNPPDGGGTEQPEIKTYTVVFTLNGETVSTQKVEEGKDAVLPLESFRAEENVLYKLVENGNYTKVEKDEVVELSWQEADDEDKGVFALSYMTLLIKNGKLYVSDVSPDYPLDYIVLPSAWGFFEINGIASSAFSRIPQVKKVKVGKYCTEIDWSAFSYLPLLEEVAFDEENPSYSAKGLFVTNKEGKELILYLGEDGGELTLPAGITSVADGAFSGSGFTKITAIDGLEEIGDRAFYGCAFLEEIILPDSVETIGESAFENCTSLKVLPLPYGVKTVGNRAFAGCVAATEVKFEALSMQAPVADNAVFDNAGALNGLVLNVGKSVKEIPARLFDGNGAGNICLGSINFTADGALESIGASAFASTEIKELVLPSSVKIIASGAFSGCTALERVEYRAENALSQGISGTAFAGAGAEGSEFVVGKEAVSVPDYLLFSLGEKVNFTYLLFEEGALESIGILAFAGAGFKGETTIPSTVSVIGDGAFSQSAFSAVNVDEGNAVYKSEEGIVYNADKTTLIAYPAGKEQTSFTVEQSVEEIGGYAFAGASYLEEVKIYAVRVGNYAFYDCRSLKAVCLEEGVEEIMTGAFTVCTALKDISCPSSLKSIGENSFAYCSALENATLNEGLKTIGSRAFAYCDALGEVEIPSTVESVGEGVFDK